MTSVLTDFPFHISSVFNPASPNSRIFLLSLYILPFICFLTGIALYRAHLTTVPVESNTGRGGDWADEVAFSSVFLPIASYHPPPTLPHNRALTHKNKKLFLSLLSSLILLARLSFQRHTAAFLLKYYIALDLLL